MARRLAALLLVAGVRGVLADSILQTGGFSNCGPNASIKVQRVNIEYNNDNKTVIFDVAGSSTKQQNVTAVLNVTAYGNQVYSNTFDRVARRRLSSSCVRVSITRQPCSLVGG